jgi:hypothetical protein
MRGSWMLNAIFRPAEQWPGKAKTYGRRRAPFRATYPKTLDLLEAELNHLRAKDIVIQAYFRREDIRNDGWPRSSARPSQPGVILRFDANKESYSYPCDTFDAWEDNLRAIALSLQALRAVDRYGVTRGREQYQGFKRLGAPATLNPWDVAVQFIASRAGVRVDDVRNDLDGAYRLAARKLHPDQGGSHELFVQLQNHYRTLKMAAGGVQ